MTTKTFRIQKAVIIWIVMSLSIISLLDNGLSFHALRVILGMSIVGGLSTTFLYSCIHKHF